MELSLHVNDKLKLYSRTFLSDYHKNIINLLYQPIMGIEATSLYHILASFLSIEKLELVLSHRQLLTFFNWDLKKFVLVRNKLESIGLLNVLYHPKEGYYVYEIKQPLNAKQYFQDSNLNIHLLYLVGEGMYEYLEKKFIMGNLDSQLVNITKNFEDIYQLLTGVPGMPSETQYVQNTINNFSVPLNYDFDFELFSMLVSRNFVNTQTMSDLEKEAIVKEAALYRFDAQMMSEIVLESMSNDGLDVNVLHTTASSYYKRLKTKKIDALEMKPAMTEKQFNEHLNKKTLTHKEKALRMYKTKTPIEWLRILQNNTEVPNSFLEVVKVLYDDYHLPTEVINVLIEFIRSRTDGKLPLEYAKTVASSWVYENIQTSEAAIEIIEKIKVKEQEFAKRGEVAPTYVNKKNKGRVVETPAWMKEEAPQTKVQVEEEVNVDELKKLLESFK